MTLSAIELAAALARQFEGCRLRAYRDSAGYWTIGWGCRFDPDTGLPVGPGDMITQATADRWLEQRMFRTLGTVSALMPGASAPQRGACCDLAYNIGEPAFSTSTLLRLYRAGDIQGAADQFPLWDKEHRDGSLVEVAGLLRRRLAERGLFLSAG